MENLLNQVSPLRILAITEIIYLKLINLSILDSMLSKYIAMILQYTFMSIGFLPMVRISFLGEMSGRPDRFQPSTSVHELT